MEGQVQKCAFCQQEISDDDGAASHHLCVNQHADCELPNNESAREEDVAAGLDTDFEDGFEIYNTTYEAVAPPNSPYANIDDGVDAANNSELNGMNFGNSAGAGSASGGYDGGYSSDERLESRRNFRVEASEPFMVQEHPNAAEVPIPQNQVQPNPQNRTHTARLRDRPIDENTSPAEVASYLAQRVLAGEHRSAWDRTFLQPTGQQDMQIRDFFRCFNNLNNQMPRTLNPVERIVHMTNSLSIANDMARRRARRRRRREENANNNN